MLKQKSIWFTATLVVSVLLVIWLAIGVSALESVQRTVTGIAKMIAFRLLLFTDQPLVQTLIACVVGWMRGKQVQKLGSEHDLPMERQPESSTAS